MLKINQVIIWLLTEKQIKCVGGGGGGGGGGEWVQTFKSITVLLGKADFFKKNVENTLTAGSGFTPKLPFSLIKIQYSKTYGWYYE